MEQMVNKTTVQLKAELKALEEEYGRKFPMESRIKELNEIWARIKTIKAELARREKQ